MNPLDHRYIVGIDLGTTNIAVSYVDLTENIGKSPKERIRHFRIPQLTGPGEFSPHEVLPSFLYIPGTYDISRRDITIPWSGDPAYFAGVWARDHGAKVPSRLASSAKSWLCHDRADRRARILPWGSGDEVAKVSPVETSAAFLAHIRAAWNRRSGDDEDLFLENQQIVITVPASFDEAARDLTLEAAQSAGLPAARIVLIEEPLAAFYSWLANHEDDWRTRVSPGELILVCDVGGGTTDFTLISLTDSDPNPRFERLAVGDHLILGGDNVDLALAYKVESQVTQKSGRKDLSANRWKQLIHECRRAKEAILDGEKDTYKITIVGEGGGLIAQTVSAVLNREMVEETVLSGFFPALSAETGRKRYAESRKQSRAGIAEFGLPYEPEPAVTCHIGLFLERHRDTVADAVNKPDPIPDQLLFNGGSLKSVVVQQQIRAAIGRWFYGSAEIPDRRLIPLFNPDHDRAVAYGAAYYGLVKIGKGVRVGSGSARSYYIGIGEAAAADEKQKAMCIVERGLEEGAAIEITQKNFDILANRPVRFDIYSSSYRAGDRAGEIIPVDDTLTALPPIQTVVDFGKKNAETRIPVHVEAQYTEMGTLALWCRSVVSNHRWRLQFQLRDAAESEYVPEEAAVDADTAEACRTAAESAFTATPEKSSAANLDALPKTISRIVGRVKDDWPLGILRTIADALLSIPESRKKTPDFESRWLNLLGYATRPGFGEGFDPHRIKEIWKVYKTGRFHDNHPRVRTEWWIFWRRVAGGLKAGQQRQFSQDLLSLSPSKKGKSSKLSHQERLEIWMAIANMERLIVKDKILWGERLISELNPKKSRSQHFWSLSRIGARELFYGSVDRVVPPDVATEWIETILATDWNAQKGAASALIELARKTGDRTRDVSPEIARRIHEWLSHIPGLTEDAGALFEVIPRKAGEQQRVFGESLPAGLIVQKSDTSE